jgi:hypothetical protein
MSGWESFLIVAAILAALNHALGVAERPWGYCRTVTIFLQRRKAMSVYGGWGGHRLVRKTPSTTDGLVPMVQSIPGSQLFGPGQTKLPIGLIKQQFQPLRTVVLPPNRSESM